MRLNKGDTVEVDSMLWRFSRMRCQNCQIVQHGEVEKARHHDGWALQCLCSAMRNPMKGKQSGFGIIIAKTRGACVIAIFWLIKRWAAIEMGSEDIHIKCCWIGLVREFGLDCPCIHVLQQITFQLSLELRDRVWPGYGQVYSKDRKSPDYKYVPRVIEKGGQPRSQQTQSRRIATPCFEGFFRVSVMLPRSHLAIWAVSVYSLFCVARTEALLMASNTVIIDVFGLTSILF